MVSFFKIEYSQVWDLGSGQVGFLGTRCNPTGYVFLSYKQGPVFRKSLQLDSLLFLTKQGDVDPKPGTHPRLCPATQQHSHQMFQLHLNKSSLLVFSNIIYLVYNST